MDHAQGSRSSRALSKDEVHPGRLGGHGELRALARVGGPLQNAAETVEEQQLISALGPLDDQHIPPDDRMHRQRGVLR